jgi:hypothetical protein
MNCQEGLIFGVDFHYYSQCEYCETNVERECRKMFKTCGDKVPFGTKIMADYEARQLGLTSYLCPYCGCYHMSSRGE